MTINTRDGWLESARQLAIAKLEDEYNMATIAGDATMHVVRLNTMTNDKWICSWPPRRKRPGQVAYRIPRSSTPEGTWEVVSLPNEMQTGRLHCISPDVKHTEDVIAILRELPYVPDIDWSLLGEYPDPTPIAGRDKGPQSTRLLLYVCGCRSPKVRVACANWRAMCLTCQKPYLRRNAK